MISDSFGLLVQKALPFELTEMQREVVRRMADFVFHPKERSAFLLRGYAGTGKTSIMSAVVRVLHSLRRDVVLLAPTGRAAKVFSQYSGYPAYTIHKEIYRQRNSADIESHFDLNQNKHKNAVFIVDESSMMSSEDGFLAMFGTGNVLNDLIFFLIS